MAKKSSKPKSKKNTATKRSTRADKQGVVRSKETKQSCTNDFSVSFGEIVESLIAALKSSKSATKKSELELLLNKIQALWNYTPTIAVFGQTGAGKSTFCNALFGSKVCEISAVQACTSKEQRVKVGLGKNEITIIDMPGVGESREADERFSSLYEEVLKEADLLLWLVKADSRAYASDKHTWGLLKSALAAKGIPYLFVLTQADKIDPSEEWNFEKNEPSAEQMGTLLQKRKVVCTEFGLATADVVFAAPKRAYHLKEVVLRMVTLLPDEKKSAVLKFATPETQSDDAQKVASEGFWKTVWEFAKEKAASVVSWVKDNPDASMKIGEAAWNILKRVIRKGK